MKSYHSDTNDDEVLREVWHIKDETAKRFRSVAEYVKSLRSGQMTPNPAAPRTLRDEAAQQR